MKKTAKTPKKKTTTPSSDRVVNLFGTDVTVRQTKSGTRLDHPVLRQLTIDDRLLRLSARLTLVQAAYEAEALIGIDMNGAEDTINRMLLECLTEVKAIGRVPGAVLNTLTPNLKGGGVL